MLEMIDYVNEAKGSRLYADFLNHLPTKQLHNYVPLFVRHFEPCRTTVRRVLEIGVEAGTSLRMWRDYFPNAEIWGFDIDHDQRNAKRSIGIVPQEIVFDPFFTPFEVLENTAGLYGIAKPLRRSMELLRAVHLTDKAEAYARTLSGGMKRRLLIAKALVHQPPVLVLDEPTAGVDVELRRQLWELVEEMNAEGVTVVLTTHYLEEAEELCDRIAIINHGQLIANKPTRELVGMAREKVVVLTLDRDVGELPSHPAFLKCETLTDRTIAITYDKDRVNAGEVLALVQSQGFAIADVTTREADLEDVFVTLTSDAVAD